MSAGRVKSDRECLRRTNQRRRLHQHLCSDWFKQGANQRAQRLSQPWTQLHLHICFAFDACDAPVSYYDFPWSNFQLLRGFLEEQANTSVGKWQCCPSFSKSPSRLWEGNSLWWFSKIYAFRSSQCGHQVLRFQLHWSASFFLSSLLLFPEAKFHQIFLSIGQSGSEELVFFCLWNTTDFKLCMTTLSFLQSLFSQDLSPFTIWSPNNSWLFQKNSSKDSTIVLLCSICFSWIS